MRRIRETIESGVVNQPFGAADVNRALKMDYAGVFLPKHRVGNPGMKGIPNTQHFVRLSAGLYRLK